MRVLGVSGSLRRDSHNRRLLQAAAATLPPEAELVVYEGLKAIPPFDEDDEHSPARAVHDWRGAISDADALLFATPEYNSSIPGHLKNALDWASRPIAEAALANKPAAVIGASTGSFGAVWAQAELRKALAAAGARVVEGEVAVGHAPTRFDETGELLDENLREPLAEVVESLVASAAEREQLVAA